MEINNFTLFFKTLGFCDLINITDSVEKLLINNNFSNGLVTIFIPGATGGITTIEYEPGAINDFKKTLEKLVPQKGKYEHNQRWLDGNGFSHIRSALIGPSLSIPFNNSKLNLGTWQQVILCDFDNNPRDRKVIIQVIGN